MSRCYRCNVSVEYLQSVCAACRQIEAIDKQTKHADKLESQRSLQASFDAIDAAADRRQRAREQQQAMIQAEEDAARAKEQSVKNARLVAEGTVSYEDAYKYGLYFLESSENEYVYNTLSEDGKINYSWIYSGYKLQHLQQAFTRGLKDSIKDIPTVSLAYMKEQAYLAGYNCSDSFLIKFKNSLFTSATSFCFSACKRVVDLNTGRVSYTHSDPFYNSEELNQCYRDGITAKCAEENTAEKIVERMTTEVADTLAKQAEEAHAEELKRLAKEEEERNDKKRWEENHKKQADDKGYRLYAVIMILLIVVGFIVGLWVTNHPFLSIIAGGVAICGLFSGWLGPFFE